MTEESRPVEDSELEQLSSKLDAFAETLDPAEQVLLRAMLTNAGGVAESEVEGFGSSSFRMASMLAMDPLRGGSLTSAKEDSPVWMQWSQSRDIPVSTPKK